MSAHTELDSLQRTLNHAIDAFREELIKADLPPLTLEATEPHVLDNDAYLPSPRLYEARRLVLGASQHIRAHVIEPIFLTILYSDYCAYNIALDLRPQLKEYCRASLRLSYNTHTRKS